MLDTNDVGRTSYIAKVTLSACIGIITLTAGGISAWYGMAIRLSLVESRLEAHVANDTRVYDSMTARIDRLLQELQDHRTLPAHAVAAHMTEELARRITVIEQQLELAHQRKGLSLLEQRTLPCPLAECGPKG